MARMNESFEAETRARSRARFLLDVLEALLEDIEYLAVMIEMAFVDPHEGIKLVYDRIESSVYSVHVDVDPIEAGVDGVEARVHRCKPAVRPALESCEAVVRPPLESREAAVYPPLQRR